MKEKIRTYGGITLGTVMTASAISMFFVPNQIVNGGASGLATIMYYAFGIRPSVSNAVINAVLLLGALLCFGWGFVAKTLYSICMLTILIEVFSAFPPITDNTLLAALFGATLYGVGIGIVLSQGSTTGGTDILGRLIQNKFPQWKIGKILLGVDLTVICLSFAVFQTTDGILYGILALYVSTTAIDTLMRSLNISKLAFLITEHGKKIAKMLVDTSPRGVTLVEVTGAYTNESKQMLICALKENEIPEFQRKVLEWDENAFLIYSESQQIVGNGFYIYK